MVSRPRGGGAYGVVVALACRALTTARQVAHSGLAPCPYRWQGCWQLAQRPTSLGAQDSATVAEGVDVGMVVTAEPFFSAT